MPVRNCGLISG